MKVGWVSDYSEYTGGAELTQAEFRAAAPKGVEVIDCPPDEIADCDLYVVHNHVTYPPDLQLPGKVVRYHHDIRPQTIQADVSIFCSPLQRERLGAEGPVIPPPLDLQGFRPTRQQRRNHKREGACCVGAFMNPGKGGQLVSDWADRNEPVDVYGFGPYLPAGPNINLCGEVEQHRLRQILIGYERFVFLPTAIEPFGRCVVEAWAAGCRLVINGNVGARYWIERPAKLTSAAEDFWKVVVR